MKLVSNKLIREGYIRIM